jgi:hypothetical protein
VRVRNYLLAAIAVVALATSVGCTAQAAEPTLTDKLAGSWFDNATGAQYNFVSDSMVVVPTAQPGNGNAVEYRLLGDRQLDIVTGKTHRVSTIDSLDGEKLVLADPLSGVLQPLLRDAGATRFASELQSAAIDHLGEAGSLSAAPDIEWADAKPTGADSEWTEWSPATIDTYIASWDWTGIKRTKTPVVTSGGGATMGYSFTLKRTVSSETSLTETWTDPSIEATAGLPLIDVGFSAARADYPAGTLVYQKGGLLYFLGDGFAIPVARDEDTENFVPVTHR